MTNKAVNAVDDDNVDDIWDRPYRKDGYKESAQAFETFLIFRDMGATRSLNKVMQATGFAYDKIRHWSTNYKWASRINAMNVYKSKEAQKLNKKIQKKAIAQFHKRLEAKNRLIDVIIDVLDKNAEKFDNEEIDFKEFSNLINLVTRIDNVNIADMKNIKELEQEILDDSVDAQNINALINNFNVVLGANNSDAIDTYQDELEDENY